MILTDQDKNKILIRLASWHNLRYREELYFQEAGWVVTIIIEQNDILVRIKDAFGHRVDVDGDLRIAITRGIRTKINNEKNERV